MRDLFSCYFRCFSRAFLLRKRRLKIDIMATDIRLRQGEQQSRQPMPPARKHAPRIPMKITSPVNSETAFTSVTKWCTQAWAFELWRQRSLLRMWLQRTVLNRTLILLDTSKNSYLLRQVRVPKEPKMAAHLVILMAYCCKSTSEGVVSTLSAVSKLISLQMLGRYMKNPAWTRVMAPQTMYFLSSGLQIPHNFLYS